MNQEKKVIWFENPVRLITVNPRRSPPVGREKIRKVMREFREGKLKSFPTGRKVSKISQARAIALHEQRKEDKDMARKTHKRHRRNGPRKMSALQARYFGKRSHRNSPRRRHARRHRSNPYRASARRVRRNSPRRHHVRRYRHNPSLRSILKPSVYALIGFAAPPYIRRFAAKYIPQISSSTSPWMNIVVDGVVGWLLSMGGERFAGAEAGQYMMIGSSVLVGAEVINQFQSGTVTIGYRTPMVSPGAGLRPTLGLHPGGRPMRALPASNAFPRAIGASASPFAGSNRYAKY